MVTRMLPAADMNGPQRMLAPPGDAGRVLDLGRDCFEPHDELVWQQTSGTAGKGMGQYRRPLAASAGAATAIEAVADGGRLATHRLRPGC